MYGTTLGSFETPLSLLPKMILGNELSMRQSTYGGASQDGDAGCGKLLPREDKDGASPQVRGTLARHCKGCCFIGVAAE